MLTLGQLVEAIEHRLGGPVAPELGGGTRVANDAGRLFYSLHGWRHALRVSVAVTVAAGDTFLVVPADFKGLLSCRKTNNPYRQVVDVGARDLLSWRQTNIQPWNADLVNVEPDMAQPSGWRIGIYPAISATEAGAYTLDYDATWVDKTAPGQQVSCAQFAEPLLIHIAREYAMGLDLGDLDQRLSTIKKGLLWEAAIKADGSSQDALGRMSGGAVQQMVASDPYSYLVSTAMKTA